MIYASRFGTTKANTQSENNIQTTETAAYINTGKYGLLVAETFSISLTTSQNVIYLTFILQQPHEHQQFPVNI